jgi:haloacid dehalogenase superfamily, subfamily IA, variant 3 with third motif having DD or ED/haloacid dehalogenase superfamily, subfamily IA, variant 1 with third motif having Dx(3-4)D or Dx(3-4)E
MVNTVLFDMDGLLLDTEPLWGESMLRIAAKHNIPITAKQFKETTGLRIYEVTDYWAIKYPWQGSTSLDVANEILDDIIAASKTAGRVLPGVIQTLELLRQHNFKIGLASSSPAVMIDALVEHFEIKDYFDCITSADAVDLGKPHPAVFLHCAQSLGSSPLNCLVLEDSVNGMIAGKAARMKVLVVPDEVHFDDPRFSVADAKLRSLEDFDLDVLKRL